jgi:hypothetical protein
VTISADAPSSRPSAPAGPAMIALGYLLYAVAGALCGVLEVTLVPLRAGAHLVPLAPVLTVLVGVVLPAISRCLTDSVRSALPPVIAQVLTLWVLSTARPEGDVLMPAGSTAWVSYSVLILGTIMPLVMLGVLARPGPWPAAGFARRFSRAAGAGSDSDGAR